MIIHFEKLYLCYKEENMTGIQNWIYTRLIYNLVVCISIGIIYEAKNN
jgi:hypothetical protein